MQRFITLVAQHFSDLVKELNKPELINYQVLTILKDGQYTVAYLEVSPNYSPDVAELYLPPPKIVTEVTVEVPKTPDPELPKTKTPSKKVKEVKPEPKVSTDTQDEILERIRKRRQEQQLEQK